MGRVFDEHRQIPQRTRAQGLGSASIALAAGIALAALGCAPLGSGTPPQSTSPTGPTRSPGVDPSPSLRPAPSPTPMPVWEQLGVLDGVGPVDLADIARSGDQLYAIGRRDGSPGGPVTDPLILRSVDGRAWTVAADATGLGATELRQIASDGMHVVVVGGEVFGEGDGGRQMAWTLDEDLAVRSSVLLERGLVATVASTPLGFVATGSTAAGEASGEPRIWLSPDGSTWTPAEVEGAGGHVWAIGHVGGMLVASGFGPSGSALWTSGDGRGWFISATSSQPTNAFRRLRSFDHGLIGPVGESGGTISFTQDGNSWASSIIPDCGHGVFDVLEVSWSGGVDYVAIGRSSEGSQPMTSAIARGEPAAWSPDAPVPAFDRAVMRSLALAPDGRSIVAVGNGLDGRAVLIRAWP